MFLPAPELGALDLEAPDELLLDDPEDKLPLLPVDLGAE